MINRPEPEGPSANEASADLSAVTPDASGSPGANTTPLSYADPVTEDQVRLALRKVKDPELNLNIIDLGLVYGIRVDGNRVAIDMTLTSPACPAGPQIMTDAERVVKGMPGVGEVAVNLVWTPFWSPDLIEPRVRAYMGL
jgi:metal-sulfur cluster biosynthetic enzyme